MADLYYKFRENEAPSHQDFELAGIGYRGFIIGRDKAWLLWTVEMEDKSKPPIPLRGSYTSKTMVEEAIDNFLKTEAEKQKTNSGDK